jgi:RNase P/RNase MRP subunit p30
MDNIILLPRTEELEELSTELGFTKTLYKEDVVFIRSKVKKDILSKTKSARGKYVIVQPLDEESLRFTLEKTQADMVIGMEKIHPKDSLHYVRSGIDQVLAKIARDKKKAIGFSFQDIAGSLSRVSLNLKICKKYGVRTYFGNICSSLEELRSKKDLAGFLSVLNKSKTLI